MNSTILTFLTASLSHAFAVVTFIALILVFWPRYWWVWKTLDAILNSLIKRVQENFLPHKTIDRQRWDASFAGRVFILRLAAIGIVCVAIFPFGNCSFVTESFREYFIQKLQFNVTNATPFHQWEAAVFLWSAIFFILVQIYDGYHYADAVLHSCGKAYRRGLIWTAIFIAVTYFLYYLIVRSNSPLDRLAAEGGLVLLFCIQDLFFMWSYSKEYQVERDADKRHRLDKTSDNYLWFLLLLDIPGLFAFGVVWAYLRHCQFIDGNQEWQSPFASGAAALNLLLINVVYSALAVWQKYLDAEPPAPSLVPPTINNH